MVRVTGRGSAGDREEWGEMNVRSRGGVGAGGMRRSKVSGMGGGGVV